MRYKRIMMLTVILACLLAVSTVSATDNVSDDSVSVQNQDNNIISEIDNNLTSKIDDNVLSANPKTFTDLNNLINGNTKTHIYLNCNYTYNPGTDSSFKGGIGINRTVTIHGNGYTIDGNNIASIFTVSNNNDVVFRDIVFVNGKTTGGGAAISHGLAVDCSFIDNSAYWGGAIFYGSAVNCSFIDNSAVFGGAMYNGSAVNCSFVGNSAHSGGALYQMSASNCTFKNNYADNNGGAMCGEGNVASNCVFINNSANNGGATYNIAANYCTFSDNTAIEYGGAMYGDISVNSNFTKNHANNYGGAVYDVLVANCLFEYNSAENGGAMSKGRATDCTFNYNNATAYGGAIYGSKVSTSSKFKKNYAPNGRNTYNVTWFDKDNTKSFTELNELINNNNDTDIYLNYNYTFLTTDSSFKEGITISRAVTIHGNGFTIDADNTARIFTVSNSDVVFRDIIFVNGKTAENGGAILGSCTSVNCTFINNYADDLGGAIYNGSAVNSTFINNYAFYGGAIYNGHALNCSFVDNSADYGGAMRGGSARDCSFVGNSADYGGAIYDGSVVNCSFVGNSADYGGAMRGGSARDCSFINNSAKLYGGALYRGSAMDCSFVGNSAEDGGAMEYGSASNCIFQDNHANSNGGAMNGEGYVADNCVFINNSALNGGATYQIIVNYCTFSDNIATECGGAMYSGISANSNFTRNHANNDGGAVYDVLVVNCLFEYNSAKNGGAMSKGRATDCTFNYNNATDYGGAICDAKVSTSSKFKNNYALSGKDTYNVTWFNKKNTNSFADLNDLINNNNQTDIYLSYNYTCDLTTDFCFMNGICIDRVVTIHGNGFIIDGDNVARIFNVSNSDVVFKDIVFINGKSYNEGGAILGSCTCVNCTFINNYAKFDGGAMYEGSAVNCSFVNNSARWGGAMYEGSAVNCTFIDNYAEDDGGAMYEGSAVNCSFVGNSADYCGALLGSAVNCTFINNSAEWVGALRGSAVNCIFINNSASSFCGAIGWGDSVNCIFINNSAGTNGGAIYSSSSISVVNCTFINNSASNVGGAIEDYSFYGDSIIVVNCSFVNNSAKNGGAMWDCSAVNCSFIDNFADEDGGAMYDGSAVNCTFVGNSADDDGGAMFGFSSLSAENCSFINNSASDSGGAIWGGSATLNCIFINNSARCGGAIYGWAGAVNCIFINNSVLDTGGAVNGGYFVNCSFVGNSAGDDGGAMYDGSAENCSFVENLASYKGGAAVYGSFSNCIFTRNSAYKGGAIANFEDFIIGCTFVENSANVGGAVDSGISGTIKNSNFTGNSALWEAGAVNSVNCVNCSFTENYADYGGAMKYGVANNCIFTGNYAIFGGASYISASIDCSFIENYADYGGASYASISIGCSFIKNFADFGGAMYGVNDNANSCRFINNTARNGGATYQVKAKDSYFEDNEATENGGAMYGESATNCIFKDNKAGVHGNDTYNTIISDSSYDNNIIYFDASAAQDGDGSENNPYKYLYPSRITPGVTAYFAKGTYDLNSTCIIDGARLIGRTSGAVINSRVSNQYDFIVKQNSYLELYNLQLINVNILNHATLFAKDSSFEGNDVFDLKDLPEIESGSGLFDSSYGGVIVCDAPSNVRSTLILDGCQFDEVYDAFNGGVIAAVNSDISISNTGFMYYSATYKGGAIYCVDSNLNIHDSQFAPFTVSSYDDSAMGRYDDYTSYYGGSIYCENCDMYVHQSNFNGSVSFSFGGCIASLNSYITIEESSFNNSLSLTDGGGAIYNSKSKLRIFNSTFDGNDAEFGGAICNVNSILDSYNSYYRNNSANYYGGVIYDIYGTLNFFKNGFNVSHALIGGGIYTRITNNISLYSNDFGDSFAQEGAVIFFDGKKDSLGSYFNSFGNKYHIFAEFKATLDDENYYLISNPLYYQLSSEENPKLYLPYPIFEVNDGLVSIVIYDCDDASNISSIATGNVIRNVSAKFSFSEEFINPVLNLYLLEDINNGVFFDRENVTNVYKGSREELFDGYNIIKTYSIDLSNNNNYDLTESYAVDFSIKSDNIYEDNSFSPVSLINDSSSNSSDVRTLPAYYDSNDYGFVSSVKDQKNGGNCWAFAGLATLETCLKKATGVTYDFSEENAKNLMAAYSVYGVKIETNFGGYDSMMMSYLTSWLGPIDESIESYDDYSSISVLENPMFHIQNIKFLPARSDSKDNDLYKLAIMDYGAVSVIFKWGNDYHAVSLVGWDDNYVGYDSVGNKANGVWIFKNSFGEDWENNGFGYLSYNQKISEQIDPGLHAYTFVFNDANPYSKVYQYDYAGVSQFYHYPNSIYFKNTFVAEDDSLLSAFSTYFDTQTNYTVIVYVNDEFVFAQNGTSAAGYYTIRFNNFIQLNKDDKFSIAVHNHNTKGYSCIPLCYAEEITKKTFNDNVSFVSLDGETWYDLHDYVDSCHVACIKAFTQNINPKRITISTNDVMRVNTKNFNVKVYFDDFESIDSINYCLLKFVVDGESYYAQIKDGVACLNLKLDDGIHSLSAQYKDNIYESNVVQLIFTVDASKESYSFNALQDIVDSASDKSVIFLDHDYVYDEYLDDGNYGVRIDKQVTIIGNGHVIDGLNKATAFYIASNNVVLNDIVVVNTSSVNGGGVYIAGCNVTLSNCIFINSSATQFGGAIYSLFDINLNNCQFINDSANIGGGLYLMSAETSYIEGSCFVNNSAVLHGSAIYMVGAGNVLVSSTNFTSNVAGYNGGAVFSGVYSNNFTGCSFTDNYANFGGAVFSNAKVNEFVGCDFANNSANESGGAINAHNKINVYDSDFINNSVTGKDSSDIQVLGGGAIASYDDLNIYNSNFISNHVVTSGGALYTNKYLNIYKSNFINNSAFKFGGAIFTTPLQLIKDGASEVIETEMIVTKFTKSNYYDSTFVGNYAEIGGAIYNSDLVENCTFVNNSASNYGGAIENDGTMNIYSSSFIDNSANYGAAIENSGNMNIYSSCFIGNSANYGAAIDNDESLNVYSSNFTNNSVSASGGAIYSGGACYVNGSNFVDNNANWGGAVYLQTEGVIANSSFVNNSAGNNGGAINNVGEMSVYSCDFTNNYANKTAAGIYSKGACKVVDSDFADNFANWGGAVYLQTEGVIANSSFVNNSAINYGGAVDNDGTMSISGSSFVDNSANYGAAIISFGNVSVYSSNFTENSADKSGGAIYSNGAFYVNGSNFVDNNASWGGAIYLQTGGVIANSSFVNNSAINYGGAISKGSAVDCIFIDNSAGSYGGAMYYGSADWCYFQDNVAALDGDDIYNTEVLTVFNVPDFISYYKSGDKLIVNLTYSNGVPIADANVTISVYKNGALVGNYYCLSGDGWVVDLEAGDYVAVVCVDSHYLVDPVYADISVVKFKTNISIEDNYVEYGGDATLIATLINNATGQPIKGANVKFTVNGEKYSVKTDANGQAKLTISGLTPDTYKATVSYAGNGKYNSSSASAVVVVTKIATSVSLYYDKTTGELVATLINSETGQAIKGANVVFNLNGVKTAVKTNKLGEARLSIGDVDPDNFNAGISYGGNSKYLKSTGSIRIAEGKIPTGVSNSYNRETGEVIATLINADTGIAIKGATVVFNINGVKTALKTDKLGQVKLSVADLSLGVNSIGSSYGGNFKYSGSTTSINIVKI